LTLDDDGVEQQVLVWVLAVLQVFFSLLTGTASLTGSKYLNRVRFRIVLFLFKPQSKQNSNENEAK
jgi:hypothetical protein